MPPPRGSAGRHVSMFDVARLAGVSHQTVSRVLNGSDAVRDSTRQRVTEAIDQLGYRRNLAARALVTRRTATIGVICFNTTLFGPASMLYAIEQAATEAGFFVSVATDSTVDSTTLPRALRRLEEQSVEGVIVIAPLAANREALRTLRNPVPVVAVDATAGLGIPVVGVDQTDGARQMTRHLLGGGATTVWHITGPAEWTETDARLEGWRNELIAQGCAIPEPLHGDWTPRSGYAAGLALGADPTVEAVFVGNDQMALGVLRGLAESGRSVPGDVLVGGFDDVPESEFFCPPLTTVRQDFASVGRRSVDLLVEEIERGPDGQPSTANALIPAELIVRQSSVRR
ncbi:LacI family DNA-binding transcriptional regulator [Mycobacterium sp. smrl_JER01]|uniref:LacI family DNA-binding transcriptional regulator n=1 Tax=Mycobacterium sp. smrl_JER01 TaxID=3402633 RepID=UPI003AC1527A